MGVRFRDTKAAKMALIALFSVFAFLFLSAQAEIPAVKLSSGDSMPIIGFGTYIIRGQDLVTNTLDLALQAGYRSFDTAIIYQNEAEIGNALQQLLPKYNLTRADIFLTSKFPPPGNDPKKTTLENLEASLKRLQTDYLDLYLIHWPEPQSNQNHTVVRDEIWQALVDAKNKGLVKNIGISNFDVRHVNELLQNTHGVVPAVDQVEWHPHYHRDDLLKLCQDNGIFLQAFFSLGGDQNKQSLLTNPAVVQIAEKLGKSPAQVLLRWAVQRNIGVIPKSTKKEHIDSNIQLDFEIPEEDMQRLDQFPRRVFD